MCIGCRSRLCAVGADPEGAGGGAELVRRQPDEALLRGGEEPFHLTPFLQVGLLRTKPVCYPKSEKRG